MNRLATATGPGGSFGYSYDPAGNPTAVHTPSGDQAFSYDAAGRLTSDGTTAYTYDAAGNQTTAGTTSYGYDALGQLTTATIGAATTSYAYNGAGLRVASTAGGVTSSTLWDQAGDLPVPVLDGTTSLLFAGTQPLAQTGSSGTNYLLTDALGSVRDLTNSGGSVVGTASYNPYGTPATSSGQTPALGYTGALAGPGGLVYDQARYYNPATTTFTSPDTVIPNAPGTSGYNPYTYTTDNPTTLIDPTGHVGTLADADTAMALMGDEDAENDSAALNVLARAISFAATLSVAIGATVCATIDCFGSSPSTGPTLNPQPQPAPQPTPKPGTRNRNDGLARMVFQVQWNSGMGSKAANFSDFASAPLESGVTLAQAEATLFRVVATVTPAQAQQAARTALPNALRFLRSAQAGGGLTQQGHSWSFYFKYRYRDARIDIENKVGWNVRE